ncbi:MAG: hypothetical protein M1326_04695, partial [Cyanobacteria bacterium]|nr:hypothetical protein [Cyanobacteriota bacterium]
AEVKTNIDVSNNGANSQNTVNVETNTGGNTINGQSVSKSTSKPHTSIKINTNGVEKTYESDQPGDVNIQSDNGNVKVNIKNNGAVKENIEDKIKDKKASVEAMVKEKKEKALSNKSMLFNLGQFIKNLFKFSFFSW